jgi:hypothetical protein
LQSVELFLNLLWVVISGVALVLWQVHWRHEHTSDRGRGYRARIALVCVLVLLFFPISLTDDLHTEILLIGDSSAQRRSVSAFADGHKYQTAAARAVELLAIALGVLHVVPGERFDTLVSDEVSFSSLLLARPTRDRAPPSVLL